MPQIRCHPRYIVLDRSSSNISSLIIFCSPTIAQREGFFLGTHRDIVRTEEKNPDDRGPWGEAALFGACGGYPRADVVPEIASYTGAQLIIENQNKNGIYDAALWTGWVKGALNHLLLSE